MGIRRIASAPKHLRQSVDSAAGSRGADLQRPQRAVWSVRVDAEPSLCRQGSLIHSSLSRSLCCGNRQPAQSVAAGNMHEVQTSKQSEGEAKRSPWQGRARPWQWRGLFGCAGRHHQQTPPLCTRAASPRCQRCRGIALTTVQFKRCRVH